MPTVIVTAIRDFEYAGHDYAPGDPVVCRPAEAAAFKYRGWVNLTPPRTSRAKYHTREMTAQSVVITAPAESVVPVVLINTNAEDVAVTVPRRRRRRAAAETDAE